MTLRTLLFVTAILVTPLISGSAVMTANAADLTPGKFMVIDPPQNFSAQARDLGFAHIERVELSSLDMTVFRLTVPAGQTIDAAVEKIEKAFPEVVVETDAETF